MTHHLLTPSRRPVPCIRIREPGAPDVLVPGEIELPPLLPHEVRVRVAASGVNRADLLERLGRYPGPAGAPPGVPGLEYSGVIEEVGSACTLRQVGDRVMGLVPGGGYAAALNTPERETLQVPEGIDTVSAAAIPEAFMTAWDAAFAQGRLGAGETLLIHAVGSGVGTAGLQLARWGGARVVGTSRTLDKLERARAFGLDAAILVEGGRERGEDDRPDESDWPDLVRAATGGRGADVVLDLVGSGYAPGTLASLAEGARWIVVGVPSGKMGAIDLRRLMALRASITGTVLRARPPEEKALLARRFETNVLSGFRSGALEPVVDTILPAAEAPEAHRLMASNETFGKLLLRWSGE